MRHHRLGAGEAIDRWGSTGARASRLLRSDRGAAVTWMRYGPGAVLGRHDATLPQLLIVVEGSGWVAGADRATVPISAGEAASWDAGESHESGSDAGMTAVIVESPDLDPDTLAP